MGKLNNTMNNVYSDQLKFFILLLNFKIYLSLKIIFEFVKLQTVGKLLWCDV